MRRFEGKVAVVTGASGGIGSAIVKELLMEGLVVVGLDMNISQLQALTDDIVSTNESIGLCNFHPMQCDITNEKEIKDTFASINAFIGPIHILLNNAGVNIPRFLAEVTAEDYDKIFDTNVKGLLLCAKEALKSMMENSIQGHIININSVSSLQMSNTYLGHMLYPASKHAARAISEGLRREVTNKKLIVKVSDISPGLTKTKLTEHIISECTAGDTQILMPEDVARACVLVLNTPPHVLISELTIQPVHY